jgi:transglutaminase-like putative cysteine protease
MKKIAGLMFLAASTLAIPCFAENFIVKGDMASTIHYELQHQITAGDAMRKLSLSFVLPQSFESPTYQQQITNLKLSFLPDAQERKTSTDGRGNSKILVTWTNVPDKISAIISFDTTNHTGLKLLETDAPFPLTNLSYDMADYLKATAQVQSDNPEIRKLSLQLTKDVKTQFDAVQRVISWIVDNVRYVNPPAQYDAVYSLESGK